MKIDKLNLVKPAIDFLLSEGFKQLYPPQVECVESGLLDGQSILVSAPTASGKTLIATLAMINYITKNKSIGNIQNIYLDEWRLSI